MLVRKIGTIFVHHGYPPLTHQLSHLICTYLKIDPGEGWGGNCPRLPPRGDATGAACLTRYMDNEGSADRRRWLICFGVKNPDSLQRMTIQTIRLDRLVSAEIIALFLEQLATFRQHFTQTYT